ncbi:hypothetical protein Cni_G04645 [Canna indica]|uniref:Uncharacterized protein n=1 Tax=Canna indica TaxID=4628 RepID=A0AAQ3JV65_9LILI|nr:hypothetical protein Cni_G04645 [Canna indica]
MNFLRIPNHFNEARNLKAGVPPNLSPSATVADNDDEVYIEITLDVHEDTVAVHSVKLASLLARTLERRLTSFGSSVIRTALSRFQQVSQELWRLA